MKETIDTKRAIAFLYNIYNVLNEEAFEGALSKCQITILPTSGAWGHYSVYKTWRDAHGNEFHELNINAQTLMRPIEDLATTMCHEMVHHWNSEHGIRDVSSSRGYHNKNFRDAALKTGLMNVEHDERIGWSCTSPNERMIDLCIDRGWEDLRIQNGMRMDYGRSGGNGSGSRITIAPTAGKKPSSTRKYICPCCGNSVRATKSVNIICGDCNKQMIEA